MFMFHSNKYLAEIDATPFKRKIQVDLGALFMMGGIHIDTRCETGVPGLYAAGEVSASVHGSRRIGGNALTEIIVFGARSGQFAAEFSKKRGSLPDVQTGQVDEVKALIDRLVSNKGDQEPQKIRNSIKSVMGQYAYIKRDKNGLTKALEELDKLEKELSDLYAGGIMQYNLNLVSALDLHSMVKMGKIVCMAALTREESRGFHYRGDFPKQKETAEHTVVRMKNGALSAGTKPVRM
jgi:succinate dehydrogenase/fumarate reductase flavoprotein subunit